MGQGRHLTAPRDNRASSESPWWEPPGPTRLKFVHSWCNMTTHPERFRAQALTIVWDMSALRGTSEQQRSRKDIGLLMLREHINDIMTRWSPRERPGSTYDPSLFLETPEQARRLIRHLQAELVKTRIERNAELIQEVGENLAKVERLAKKFFRWEEKMSRASHAQDLREIKKLPLGL